MLGACRIDALIGLGGMGVVYRARDLDLDRDVAVKVIAPHLVDDPDTQDRFLREARAASAVEHPNIVPVHAVGISRNPHLLYDDFHRGYVRVTLDPALWTNEFRVVDTVTEEGAPGHPLDTFAVEHGQPGALLL